MFGITFTFFLPQKSHKIFLTRLKSKVYKKIELRLKLNFWIPTYIIYFCSQRVDLIHFYKIYFYN